MYLFCKYGKMTLGHWLRNSSMFAELLEQNSDCRLARVQYEGCQLQRSHFVQNSPEIVAH